MAIFKYKMQNILDIKNKLENQARMQFAAAKERLNQEEEKLNRLYARKHGYMEETVTLRQNKLDARSLRENRHALAKMEELIRAQVLQVRLAQKNVENARAKLTEVMIERKTQEKLKEKAFEEFVMDERAGESKEIDELTSYTYGQKKNED